MADISTDEVVQKQMEAMSISNSINVEELKRENFILRQRLIAVEEENSYLKTICMGKQNKGEKDESFLKYKLHSLNKDRDYKSLVEIFGEEASDGIKVLGMDTDEEIKDLTQLSKAGSCFKADCRIQMVRTGQIYASSVKSKNGANPAILNHTPRCARVFQEGAVVHHCLSSWDKLISEYIEKRTNEDIGEDVTITGFNCLNNSMDKEKILEVLAYFLFEGSGKGDSKCKANSIITLAGDRIGFVKCVTLQEKKNYIQTIFDSIIISLRDKGMPKKITDYCQPWIYQDKKADGTVKYKGSLHLRIKK